MYIEDENVEDEYFQEVQDRYIKTLSEVNVFLKSQNKPISEAGCLPPSTVRLPPAPQPQVVDGNPENYPIWKAAFSTLTDRKDIPLSGEQKMFYLQKIWCYIP